MGPLNGVRVVELAGIGAIPFAGMVLADLGADVVRVDRPGGPAAGIDPSAAVESYPPYRGRRSVVLDLKTTAGSGQLLDLVEHADALVESHRPGVMERLGLGPEQCHARNPRLVYARLTGWGQDGPWADRAGHDINYIAIAGALANLTRGAERPVVPLNLLGDLAGGGLTCALGVVSALFETARSGRGQVIDAAMVDGVAMHLAMLSGWIAQQRWQGPPGTNFTDGGAPYYDTYRTKDGRHMAVGAIEPAFYAQLLDGLGLSDADDLPDRRDPATWPALRERFAAVFATRTLSEWAETFADTDACATPVLMLPEAAAHPHLRARATYIRPEGVLQPVVAPRFSRTACEQSRPPRPGSDEYDDVLASWSGRDV
jgi:alpha-methylacyl-CoA racemase